MVISQDSRKFSSISHILCIFQRYICGFLLINRRDIEHIGELMRINIFVELFCTRRSKTLESWQSKNSIEVYGSSARFTNSSPKIPRTITVIYQKPCSYSYIFKKINVSSP